MYESGIIANLLKVKPEGSFIGIIVLGEDNGYTMHTSDFHLTSVDLNGGITLDQLLKMTDFFKTSVMELSEHQIITPDKQIGIVIITDDLDNAKLLTGKATEAFAAEHPHIVFSIATNREMWYNYAGQASGFVEPNDAEGIIEKA